MQYSRAYGMGDTRSQEATDMFEHVTYRHLRVLEIERQVSPKYQLNESTQENDVADIQGCNRCVKKHSALVGTTTPYRWKQELYR